MNRAVWDVLFSENNKSQTKDKPKTLLGSYYSVVGKKEQEFIFNNKVLI